MKDTFLTQKYKAGYIHSCQNRATGKEEIMALLGDTYSDCKTFIGAKRAITRLMKKQSNNKTKTI